MLLSGYPGFPAPKPRLEQYLTDPDVAALMALRAASAACPGTVCDLCSGTGLLIYAYALAGCLAYGVGVELDVEAVRVALTALRERGLGHLVDIVVGDARRAPIRSRGVDVVLSNPPFGIRSKRGMDLEILREALRIARKRTVTLHAWSEGLLVAIERKVGCKPRLAALEYNAIPAFLEEHRRRVHRVKVAVVECGAGGEEGG